MFHLPHPGLLRGEAVHPKSARLFSLPISRASLRIAARVAAKVLKSLGQLFACRGAAINQKPIAEALGLLRAKRRGAPLHTVVVRVRMSGAHKSDGARAA